MSFTNAIVAGEILIRSAIRSDNYVPFNTGWRIARDGGAEFASIELGYLGTIEIIDGVGNRYLMVPSSNSAMFTIRQFDNSVAGIIWYNNELYLRGNNTNGLIRSITVDGDIPALIPTDDYLNGAPETWHSIASTLGYSNGWADNSGTTYEKGRYRMMPDGTVMLSGTLVGGTIANGTLMFTLPVRYRPAKNVIFATASGAPDYTTVIVGSNGQCTCWDVSSAPNGICLDGIRFAVAELT
jgi:hypothetical protein